MGLDFAGFDLGWSYSSFHNFRILLARAIGYTGKDLKDMRFFAFPMHDPKEWTVRQMIDPIFPLLIHSDCEGEIEAEGCAIIAPRLREIASGWPDDDDCGHKERALQLADAMETCAREDRPLEFC